MHNLVTNLKGKLETEGKPIMNRLFFLFVLLLGITTVSCSLPLGNDEEAVEEVSSPSSNSFPTTLSIRDTVQRLDTLDSYEMEIEISTTFDLATEVIKATNQVSTNPPQSYLFVTGFEGVAGIDSVSMTQIDNIVYLNVVNFECTTTTDEEYSLDDLGFGTQDAKDLLAEVGESTLVGEETINGIETVHYIFDESAFDEEFSQFNRAQGDVYIAKEGNYVVRFYIEGEASVPVLALAPIEEDADGVQQLDVVQESQVSFRQIEINILSINEPVTITVPEECEN
jgi:hypothetical protein